MEACLAEPPLRAVSSPSPSHAPFSRYLAMAFIAVIAVGFAWRIVRYLANFPIWGDEAMLLLSILDRDYAGLTQHLEYGQVAPLFFLWLERTALLLLGTSEASLHLFPFLAGIAGLVVFGLSVRRSFPPTVAGLAVAILAVSYYPIRHGTEVKPYVFDLFFAVVTMGLTLGRIRAPEQSRWLVGLLAVAPIAVFTSYPSAFVGGAVSVVLLSSMLRASWRDRVLYAGFNTALLGSFVLHYAIVGHQQIDTAEAEQMRLFLRNYWKDAFPPESITLWPAWLIRIFTGNMLAHPIGGNQFGSTGTFVLVLLGSYSLGRARNWALLGLCWLPFAFNLVAAVFQKYPFGDSARITLQLTPFICLLSAHGISQLLQWVRSDAWRDRLHLACFVLYAILGIVGLVRDVVHPFKTEHDRQVRMLVDEIAADSNGPTFLLHEGGENLLAEFLWYMRVRPIDLRRRGQFADLDANVRSCRLIKCGPSDMPSELVLASLPLDGWRVIDVMQRSVVPENRDLPPMYCRVVRLERY